MAIETRLISQFDSSITSQDQIDLAVLQRELEAAGVVLSSPLLFTIAPSGANAGVQIIVPDPVSVSTQNTITTVVEAYREPMPAPPSTNIDNVVKYGTLERRLRNDSTGEGIDVGAPLSIVLDVATGDSEGVLTTSGIPDAIAANSTTQGQEILAVTEGHVVDSLHPIASDANGTFYHAQPIAADTAIYWNESNGSLTTNNGGGNFPRIGTVVSSVYVLPASTTNDNSGTINGNTAGRISTDLNHTVIFNSASDSTYNLVSLTGALQSSIPEGGRFAFLNIGTGNVDIVPASPDTITDDVNSILYTNAAPLPLSQDEGVVFERESNAWDIVGDTGSNVIRTSWMFSKDALDSEVNQKRVNSAAGVNLVNKVGTPASIQPADIGSTIEISPINNTSILRFGALNVYNLQAGEARKVTIINRRTFNRWLRVETDQVSTLFDGMAGNFVYLRPGETREFVLTTTGIHPIGPYIYDIEVSKDSHQNGDDQIHTLVSTAHLTPPAGLIEIVNLGGEIQAALHIKAPGFVYDMVVNFGLRWEGGTAGGLLSGLTQLDLKNQGSLIERSHDFYVPQTVNAVQPVTLTYGRQSVNSTSQLNWEFRSLDTNNTGRDCQSFRARFRYVLKAG